MFRPSITWFTSLLPFSLSQCGPGARPAARVWGPQPAGPEPQTRQDPGERLRHPVQSDDRGPSQGLPAGHRQDRGRTALRMTWRSFPCFFRETTCGPSWNVTHKVWRETCKLSDLVKYTVFLSDSWLKDKHTFAFITHSNTLSGLLPK